MNGQFDFLPNKARQIFRFRFLASQPKELESSSEDEEDDEEEKEDSLESELVIPGPASSVNFLDGVSMTFCCISM
jgi:hypothetical protein